MISRLTPRTQLTLSIVVPLACIVIAALLIWPSAKGIAETNDEIDKIKSEIREQEQIIEQAKMAAGGRPLALAVASPIEEEPIVFLRQLAALSEASGIVLASVRETTPPPLKPTGQTESPQEANATTPRSNAMLGGQRPVVPPTVKELTNQVTVEGTFSEILSLIVRLENFDRILSVSQCRITAGGAVDYPNLQAVFTLSRFVAAPQPTPQQESPASR